MPVLWEFRGRILNVTVIRDWDGGTPEEAIRRALADPEFNEGTLLLFDVRESEMNPTAAQIYESARWMASLTARGLGSKFAMVVSARPYQFGLGRMAASYLEEWGVELRIFEDPAEALNWLVYCLA